MTADPPTNPPYVRWVCEDCGWTWPLTIDPVRAGAECDHCGGQFERVQDDDRR